MNTEHTINMINFLKTRPIQPVYSNLNDQYQSTTASKNNKNNNNNNNTNFITVI